VRGGGRQTDGEAENVALPSHKEKDGSSLDENGEISQVLADLAIYTELSLLVYRWLRNLNVYGLCLLTDIPTKLGEIKKVYKLW